MRIQIPLIALAVILSLAAAAVAVAQHGAPRRITGPVTIMIPGGEAGVGFDDLRFSPVLQQVLIPAGRTGLVAVVAPGNLRRTLIPGFSRTDRYRGGHDDGATSADAAPGVLFVTDRTARKLYTADPAAGAITGGVRLGAGPDYVRHVRATGEVWVTEPDREQIEIFASPRGDKAGAAAPGAPVRAAVVKVPGGPESLVIDEVRGMAYTNAWKGSTFAVALGTRKIAGRWPNGCAGSRGLALDEARGWLFVGCAEGQAVALDAAHGGRQLSRLTVGAGVDVIDYDAALAHLYLPGARAATLAVAGVSPAGALTSLGTLPTAAGAHCVAAAAGRLFVCDPDRGQILVLEDRYPPSR